jgi:hypothetical protein
MFEVETKVWGERRALKVGLICRYLYCNYGKGANVIIINVYLTFS